MNLQGTYACVVYYRITEAANRPKREFVPKRATSTRFDKSPSGYDQNNFDAADTSGYSLSPAPPSYNSAGTYHARQ